MSTNKIAPLKGKGAIENPQFDYGRLHNFEIPVLRCKILPFASVEWIINRGGKRHD